MSRQRTPLPEFPQLSELSKQCQGQNAKENRRQEALAAVLVALDQHPKVQISSPEGPRFTCGEDRRLCGPCQLLRARIRDRR